MCVGVSSTREQAKTPGVAERAITTAAPPQGVCLFRTERSCLVFILTPPYYRSVIALSIPGPQLCLVSGAVGEKS